MKKTLFLVESPLQLLNTYEAICHFDIKDFIIVIRLNSIERNNSQQLLLAERLFKKNRIKTIRIKSSDKQIIDYFKLFYFPLHFLLLNKFETIFVGNLDSGFFKRFYKKFSKNDIILMDDGTKTLLHQSTFSLNNYYNLFTIFPLTPIDHQTIILNQYKCFSKKINNKKMKNDTIFLGADIVELGIISLEEFINILKKIRKENQEIENFYYIPHRNESMSKLKIIENFMTIKNINYPVEMYGIFENSIPKKILSFYSTALFTMKLLYKNSKIQAYKPIFPKNRHSSDIENVYSFFKKHIEVVPIQ